MTSISATDSRESLWRSLLEPLTLAARLIGRHWLALVLVAALGLLARDLLLNAAVAVGAHNALAGMVVLSLVVLSKLVTIVAMLQIVRPSLPAISTMAAPVSTETPAQKQRDLSLSVVAMAVLPFFAYYAAWGFLGDTVREYSRIGLERTPLGEKAPFFDVLQSRWLVGSILFCWLLRYGAKRANAAWPASFWSFVVVACNATWIFIGLYALSEWQDELLRWIGSGDFLRKLPDLQGIEAQFSISAWAAEGFTPREMARPGLMSEATRLFFWALLPIVWFLMVAVIYGHDFSVRTAPTAAPNETRHWRGWLRDIVNHFVGGYRSRYAPVLRSVRVALSAGLPLLCVLVVGYQAISYAGAWLWLGATRLIGEHSLIDWQLIASPISMLIGPPSDLSGGILLDPLRMCLLAAAFEIAVANSPQPKATAN